jgi:death on curing protein
VNRIGNAVKEWRWPSRRSLELLHEESIAEHGDVPGLCSPNALEAALTQLQNAAQNSEIDVMQLAASYGHALIKNHAFFDGNKRAAFLGVGLLLHLNGYRLNASQVDATRRIFALAASEISEEQFAEWIRTNIVPRV